MKLFMPLVGAFYNMRAMPDMQTWLCQINQISLWVQANHAI